MTGERFILVLDEGTTSTRAMLYTIEGNVVAVASRALIQHYPSPGLVEHDAGEIWRETLACGREVIANFGGGDCVAAIGITNQRETVVAWDRTTSQPLAHAIVWQDRRTAGRCRQLAEQGYGDVVKRTGLRLDPYFCATKMEWLLGQADIAAAGKGLAFGTVDSWLTYKLTGGEHVTDPTNASRSLLLDLNGSDWDDELLALFNVPRTSLPRIGQTAGVIGMCRPEWFGSAIPITALVGDQQAATVGQGCLARGQTKLTLGTGAFILSNVGYAAPSNTGNLLGTILYEVDGKRAYALEGSIFVAGSLIKWLRDNLGLIGSAVESETQARSVQDNGGVTVLPALAGLGAPYWLPDAKAIISGLSFSSTAAHIIRAGLEAISHQCVDLATEFASSGAVWSELRIDGGMSANSWLAQDLANMLVLDVIRPKDVETTARGAAMLAAVGAGLHPDLAAASCMLRSTERFSPDPTISSRDTRLSAWHALLAAAGK